MYAIDGDLRDALLELLAEVPLKVSEPLAVGLRGAEPIPADAVPIIEAAAKRRAVERLTKQLTQLESS